MDRSVGGLAAGACYTVTANGASLGSFKADAGGRIAFSARGQSGTADFAIHASQCNVGPLPAPLPVVQLQLIRR